jgi:hypothetical protein
MAYFRTINDFDAYPDCVGMIFEQIEAAQHVIAQRRHRASRSPAVGGSNPPAPVGSPGQAAGASRVYGPGDLSHLGIRAPVDHSGDFHVIPSGLFAIANPPSLRTRAKTPGRLTDKPRGS